MVSPKETKDKQLVSKYFHHKVPVKRLWPESQLSFVNMTCGHMKFPQNYWVILESVLMRDMSKVSEGSIWLSKSKKGLHLLP